MLTIQLPEDVERVVAVHARRQNTTPEAVVLAALRQRFLFGDDDIFTPRDEWEAGVLNIGTDCGVSLSDEDLSSERLYD
jgi:hypothetical protein